jgi:transposase
MPKPYSDDLRERVIEAVEAGASRREAAESFNLSPSSAVKWLQRWRDTGSAKAKPSRGSTSPLEEHAKWLAGCRCRAARFDAGRDRRRDAQAAHSGQPHRSLAVFCST